MVDSGDGEILEEESLYGGKGRLDCHPHVSSRQTIFDLNQGDHIMFVSKYLSNFTIRVISSKVHNMFVSKYL